MFAGIAYVTILGSVSVSTIPIVGTLREVHSLMRPRFSEGLRMTTRSGMFDFCWMGRGPKLRGGAISFSWDGGGRGTY